MALGRASTILDCSAGYAMTHHLALCGREKMRRAKEEGGELARFVFKVHSRHDFEYATVRPMPWPLTKRCAPALAPITACSLFVLP